MNRLLTLDRRVIYLLVGIVCVLPFFFPLGLPIPRSAPVAALFDRIEGAPPGSVVLVSFDYGPSTGPENDPMAVTVIRHALAKGLRVVTIALYPLGGATEAHEEFVRATGGWDATTLEFRNWPGKHYGVDGVNLGYKDGAQPAMRQMSQDLHTVFPTDYELRKPVGELPLMQAVHGYSDMLFVMSVATGIICEYWANIVNAQYHLPVAVGCTAVSATRCFAYLEAKQMFALLGGVKGAAEYEKLVMDKYPDVKQQTTAQAYYAAKGWDIQSLVYNLIIVFIILGNVAYFTARRRSPAA